MSKRFMGEKSSFLVATDERGRSERALAAARALAARTGMGVRLVHAVEPFTMGIPTRIVDKTPALNELASAVDSGRELAAEGRLKLAAASFPPDIRTNHAVLLGRAADAILADATMQQVSLIVCGSGSHSYRFMTRGLSTPLSLACEANLPVMIVGQDAPVDLTRPRLRILVADDLTPACDDAVLTAFDLARALGNTELLHLHVNTLSPERLREALAVSETEYPGTAALSESAITAMAQTHAVAALRERSPERILLLEARGGSYRAEVATGRVADEIDRAAQEFEADIIVFGRHKTLHRRPFGTGKVPWHEMLAQKRIVVIAPPQA